MQTSINLGLTSLGIPNVTLMPRPLKSSNSTKNTQPNPLPLCNLCRLKQNDICLHLLSCCTNKHTSTLCTNKHNYKEVHVFAATLLSHPLTWHFTLNRAKIQNNQTLDYTLPSWLLPCSCFLSRCKCLPRLRPDIHCTTLKVNHLLITLQSLLPQLS